MGTRKDSKGRTLLRGESQRADGRYMYRYLDEYGNPKYVYSWRLVKTDKNPTGKRSKLSLREIEKQINKDQVMGLKPLVAEKVTVDDYFNKNMSLKKNLSMSTRSNYLDMYRLHIKDKIGKRKLNTVNYSDIKKLYLDALDNGLSLNTVEVLHTILHPLFKLAVRDNIIMKNPTSEVLREVREEAGYSKPKKHALSKEEQEVMMRCIREVKHLNHWEPMVTVLLGTGMRIGELLGLTWDDVDFENEIISVNHTLMYRGLNKKSNVNEVEDGDIIHSCDRHINPPKTSNSNRKIPMLDKVKDALLELKRMSEIKPNIDVIDGYSGFVMTNRYGHTFRAVEINRLFKRIAEKWNEGEEERAAAENRDPVYLPNITCHTLRHTFASRFAENNPNAKLLQTLMGHSDIRTTLDIYAEISDSVVSDEFKKMNDNLVL